MQRVAPSFPFTPEASALSSKAEFLIGQLSSAQRHVITHSKVLFCCMSKAIGIANTILIYFISQMIAVGFVVISQVRDLVHEEPTPERPADCFRDILILNN